MDLKITVSMDKKTIECIDRLSEALVGINGISKIADVVTGKGTTSEIVEPIQVPKDDLPITLEPPKEEEVVKAPIVEPKKETVTEPQNWEPQVEPVVSEPTPQPETSTRTYTRDELSKATAELARSGEGAREKIQALIKDKYGVAGVMALDESRYGEYAADIREMGANI